MKDQNDFQYSLDLLRRINRLQVNGGRLSHRKILDHYNVWIFFQNNLFFNDIKAFRLGKWRGRVRESAWRDIKENCLRFIALGVTFFSLISVVIRNVKIMVYSVDRINSPFSRSDARLDPVYEVLFKSRVRFFECFHTILGGLFISNLFKRRRLAVYQKAIDQLFPLYDFFGLVKDKEVLDWAEIDLSEFDEEEMDFVKEMVEKYLELVRIMEYRVKIFRRVFESLKLEAILTIDDPRDYNDVVLAARLSKVPIYAFQHGHFTKYHVGWLNDGTFVGEIPRPDRIYVWSKFWKRELLRLGTYFREEEIWVGGLKARDSLAVGEPRVSEITVVIPFEIDSNKELVKKYIDEMLQAKDIKVLFKLRSDMNAKEQLVVSLLENYSHPRFAVTSDTQEAIQKATVFAGTYSTFLYDMVATEKPVVYLDSTSDFGEGLIINKLADKVTLGKAGLRIGQIAKTSKELLKKRKKELFGKGRELMVHAVERLLKTIKI